MTETAFSWPLCSCGAALWTRYERDAQRCSICRTIGFWNPVYLGCLPTCLPGTCPDPGPSIEARIFSDVVGAVA